MLLSISDRIVPGGVVQQRVVSQSFRGGSDDYARQPVLLPPCAARPVGYKPWHGKTATSQSVRPDQAFNGWQFTAQVMLWAVRWYLMFPINHHDLELMLQDVNRHSNGALARSWCT